MACSVEITVEADSDEVQIAKLLPQEGQAIAWFGQWVALGMNTAVVSAKLDNDNGNASGAVYIFEQDASDNWTEFTKLLPLDGQANAWFGQSVALEKDIVLIGAFGNSDNGIDAGAAYVFERDGTGTWKETAKLLTQGGEAGDQFGNSAALYGETALVGSIGDNDNGIDAGAVYVFERKGLGNWTEATKLLPRDGEAGDQFGRSVDLDGGIAVVGSWDDDDNGSRSGSAYVFERDGLGNWSETTKLLPRDGEAGDQFGRSIALDGGIVVVGAWGDDFSSASLDSSRWGVDKSTTANSPVIESGRLVFDNERHADDDHSAYSVVTVLEEAQGISADLVIAPESTLGSNMYSKGGIEIGAENAIVAFYFSLEYDVEEGQPAIGFKWQVSDESSGEGDSQELWTGYDPTGFQIGKSYNLAAAIDENHRLNLFVDGQLFQTSPSLPLLTSITGFYIASWTNNGRIRGYADNVGLLTKSDESARAQNSPEFLFEFGSSGSGPGQFVHPEDVATDSKDRLIISDIDRIKVFDSTGGFLFEFGGSGSGPGQFESAEGVAVDSNDRIIVADEDSHRIQVFDSAGGFLFEFGSLGSGPGQFNEPGGGVFR